uniref:Leucine-rich repeat-containing N-terminal plant-type domain-containing protein n=1 Tax=Oryza glumipatula TaxID=40148 RepID=A0A0D9Y3K9_9ORYZ
MTFQTKTLLMLSLHLLIPCSSAAATYTNHTRAISPAVPCLPDQAAALLQLKSSFSITNESMAAFDSWKAGEDCCRWEGVSCGDADGRVTWLDLGDCGLESGQLDPVLFKLTSLEYLNLSGNDFNMSEIPSTGFERLSKLTHLNLSSSNIAGQVPVHSIGQLNSLVSLDMSSRFGLSELFDDRYTVYGGDSTAHAWQLIVPNVTTLVANLINLKELRLGLLDLSNIGAEWCSALSKYTPNLRVLSLPFCSLNGNICRTLSSLRSLSVIDLQYNHLTGSVPEFFANYSSLSVLQLSYNYLEGWVSPLIFQNKKLVTIDLHRNHDLSGTLPNFPVGSSLESLLVSLTNFSGGIPSTISNLKSLKKLGLGASGFSGELPSSIGTTYFKASRNNLSGDIPPSFCSSNLQFLDLSYNLLSGSIPSCLIEDANALQVLNLKQNQLHGELAYNMNESCTLEDLDFSDNRIEGNLPRSLVSCRKLEVLDIQNNQINDSFPCWMSVIPRLQVLILKSNKFFGQVTPTVAEESTCEFPSLRILDLASNKFSGTLSDAWFMRLKSMMIESTNETLVMEFEGEQHRVYQVNTVLTYKGSAIAISKILRTFVFIDVSNNAFHGSIPKSMGELVLLHALNMSHNSLTGPIPSQLGHLNQMEALDLSSNELLGVIPQELASLDFLGTLNLSYNKLEGKIPESLHFSSFSNSSFLGNDALCGPPLSEGCSNMTLLNLIPSEKKYVDVMLFLFSGIGFGLGFAIAIVVSWGIPIRKRSLVRQRAL